jgi:hypothetical protein
VIDQRERHNLTVLVRCIGARQARLLQTWPSAPAGAAVHAAEVALGRDADPAAGVAPAALAVN